MNRRQLILLVAALVLMGGAAGLLGHVRAAQKLAPPGVTTSPAADPRRLRVDLPERVLDYKSEWVEADDTALRALPPDTSFGQRRYTAPDGFTIALDVVLMGMDRTSLHKPQYCLEAQGWHLDSSGTLETQVTVEHPVSYGLPIARLIANKAVSINGQDQPRRCVYTYWFVADDAFSASVRGMDRMIMIASRLLRTGVLQRWAYVSCFSACAPGQEEEVFERTKKFIAAAAPGFVLVPRTVPVGGAGK